MKKGFMSLMVGFGAVRSVPMAIALPPETVAGIVLGLILFLVIVALWLTLLRANSRQDQIIREAFRYLTDASLNECEVSQRTSKVIHDILESGIRIAQMRGRDVLLYQSGKILDAERDCNMTRLAIETMYQAQTKWILAQGRN